MVRHANTRILAVLRAVKTCKTYKGTTSPEVPIQLALRSGDEGVLGDASTDDWVEVCVCLPK